MKLKRVSGWRIKLLLLVALAQIALYSAFVIWTVQQYNAYVKHGIELWTDAGIPVELVGIPSYFTFRWGTLALMLGFWLVVFWICMGIISYKLKSPSVEGLKMKMKWRLVLGIGFLCIALGLFGCASVWQQTVDKCRELVDGHKEMLEQAQGKPCSGWNFSVAFIRESEAYTIPTLVAERTIFLQAAILFLIATSVCLLTSMKLLG